MSLSWVFTTFALGQTLPQIQAETLSGVKLDLPSSLKTTHTLLVLSFQREHQEISHAWRPHLAELAKDSEVGWYGSVASLSGTFGLQSQLQENVYQDLPLSPNYRSLSGGTSPWMHRSPVGTVSSAWGPDPSWGST